MRNVTPQQKTKLISIYPDLQPWFEAKDSMSSSTAEALLVALLGKIKELQGDKGDKPVKGVDYWTSQELNQVISFIRKEATPKKGIDYTDGDKGDAYVLTKSDKREIAGLIDVPIVERVVEKTEVVRESLPKNFDVSMVKGAVSKKELEIESRKVLDGMAKVDGRIKLIDQRWHGGGLSQVSHDGTLSGTGSPSSPLSVVGGGFAGSQEKSVTVPNEILTTFTFTHTPKVIFWNGAFQTLTDDYTVSGNNITFTGSAGVPLTGDKIVNLYA